MSAFHRLFAGSTLAALAACAPSVQQEVQMGNDYAAQIAKEMPLINDAGINSLFAQTVNPLRRVAQRQDLAWDFHIVNSDQVNAFAVPGGHVYVFRGLIARARHYDEFAGAVMHEIGHVDLRHSAQQMGQMNAANLGVLISQDMTLLPGDIILCGTSIGVGSMKPGSTVEVEIAGIGRLRNRFE